MINTTDGSFSFDTFTLSSRLTLDELTKQLPEAGILSKETSGEYTNLYLVPQKRGNLYFLLRLYFHKATNRLKWFVIAPQTTPDIPSWEAWSVEKEQKANQFHISWLRDEIGNPPYQYSWGHIHATYDERANNSYIAVFLS